MKRTTHLLLATLFAFGLPLAPVQAQCMETPAQDGGGGMRIVGDQTVDGVRAMAHLQSVISDKPGRGMLAPQYFMIAFVDTATGKQITSGFVVLKIRNPLGEEGEAVRLMAREGYFGADITLTDKGVYTFHLSTKVGGEKRRQFEFKQEIK